MRAYVTREVPGRILDAIEEVAELRVWRGSDPVPREVLLEEVSDVEGLCCMLTDRIDAELLDKAPKLRVVSQMAVGVDNIDVGACHERGIRLGHTPDVLTGTVADHAVGLMLAAARRFREGAAEVEEGRWGTWNPWHLLGVDVHGATLGIVGMGRVGAEIARRVKGFDMEVIYTSPRASGPPGTLRVPLDVLLTRSDHVIVSASLNDQTRQMFDRAAFSSMRSDATFVNVSRGPIVDHGALADALESNALFSAAIDVTDPEPLPSYHRLARIDNCLVVPHVGSATLRTREAMAERAARNLIAGLRGASMPSELA